jgi:hypothetical protein
MKKMIWPTNNRELMYAVCFVLGIALLITCVLRKTNQGTSLSSSTKPESAATSVVEPVKPALPTPIPTPKSSLELSSMPTVAPTLLAQLPVLTTTKTPMQTLGIIWSPTGNSAEVWLLDPETGDNTLMTMADNSTGGLEWSPDGTHFALETWSRAWVINVESGEQDEFVSGNQTVWKLQWIGSELVHYCVWSDSEPDAAQNYNRCFLYNIKSQVTNEGVPVPVWSNPYDPIGWRALAIAPDYRHMAFLIEGDPNYYVANLVTGEVKSIFQAPFEVPRNGIIYGRWSPDGQQFAFFASRCCVDPGPYESKLYIVAADGNELKKVLDLNATFPIKNSVHPTGLMWSPDGQWLSFEYTADFNSSHRTLYVVNITGEQLHNLGVPITLEPGHRWSSDGKHIIFISEIATGANKREYDFFAVDVATGEVTRLTFDGRSKYHFDW